MKKRIILIYIISIFLLLCNRSNAYAVGSGGNSGDDGGGSYDLAGNDANLGNKTKGGGGSTIPSEHKWYDDIKWNYIKTARWSDDTNILREKFEKTNNRIGYKDNEKYWTWQIYFGEHQDSQKEKLKDFNDGKKIKFTAEKDGYYYITCVPVITRTTTTFYYSRNLIEMYNMHMDLIHIYGAEPTFNTVSTENKDITQTLLAKDWNIFLKKGQSFDVSQTTIIKKEITTFTPKTTVIK